MGARPRLLTVCVLALLVVLGFTLGVWMALAGYVLHTIVAASWCIGLVQLADQRQRDVNDAFRDAIRITDIGLCDAAKWMGLDPADLTRALALDRKLDLWRIEMLPDETVSLFYVLRAQKLGLPTFIRRALDVAAIFTTQKRSA